jgi:predicted nucleotidyltransferase/HEPN domain-containing protein
MINLSETLSYLPTDKITELETITSRIIETGKAEMVILFGSFARGDYKEERGETKGKKSDYDILIITDDETLRGELKPKLRGRFDDIDRPVQIIVDRLYHINKNIGEKQYFYTDIIREGKTLYNSVKLELAKEGKLTPAERVKFAEADYKMWFSKANESFEKSKFCISKEFLGSTSFELQQVIEMCYTAIEMVYTHYNPYEHNLETLRIRVLEFDQRVKNALPYETEEDEELFDYLNFAYIGGRYRSEEDFPITKDQLDYWSCEAKKLLELTEIICKERIDCLREIEIKS